MGLVVEKTFALKFSVRGQQRLQSAIIRSNTGIGAQAELRRREANLSCIHECKEI